MALEKFPPIAEADVTGLTATLATKEALANKKQTVTNSQTDYPSGKAVTDSLASKLNTSLLKTTLEDNLDTDIPSIKSVNTALNGKADKVVIYDNGSSLAIDGANGTWFNIIVNTNSSFTFSNITTGIVYEFLIKNSHLTDTITIILPNTADIKSDLSYDITADSYIELSMFYDGTNRIWVVSNELTK